MLMPFSRVSAGTRPASFCAWASGCCELFKTTCSELVISERMRGVGDCAPSTPRIRSEITSSEQVVLKSSQHPLAQAQNDAGRVPADTRLNGISIYFNH